MADLNIPYGAPGIASFASDTIGGQTDPRYGDTPAPTTTTITVAGPVDLKLYDVVSYDGDDAVALAEHASGNSDAYGILTAPVVLAAGQTTTVDVYRSGHWSMDALGWDASFDTDAKKKTAFEGGESSQNFVSKRKYTADGIVFAD